MAGEMDDGIRFVSKNDANGSEDLLALKVPPDAVGREHGCGDRKLLVHDVSLLRRVRFHIEHLWCDESELVIAHGEVTHAGHGRIFTAVPASNVGKP